MTKLTEHQDHYDACVARRLPLECKWFIENQKGTHPIGQELKDENGHLVLAEHAISHGYMLGMKPYLIYDELSIQPKNIGWRFESTTRIPWYDKEALKRNQEQGRRGKIPAKVVDTSKMISGFGISLNLVGWKLFLDMKYKELIPLIERGESVECLFRFLPPKKDTRTRFLVFNGKSYPTLQALRRAGIPRRSFDWKVNHLAKEFGIAKQNVSDEDRQKVFDALRLKFNCSGHEQFGCLFAKGKIFIRLEEDDLSIVLQNANADHKSPDEWLHDILQSYSYQ